MRYTRECEECGSSTYSSQPYGRVVCDDCKEQRRREAERLRTLRQERTKKLCPHSFRVLYDPGGMEYGFPAGAFIIKEEHDDMLKFNCYTVGTILAAANGERHKVIRSDGTQKLVAYPSTAAIPTMKQFAEAI